MSKLRLDYVEVVCDATGKPVIELGFRVPARSATFILHIDPQDDTGEDYGGIAIGNIQHKVPHTIVAKLVEYNGDDIVRIQLKNIAAAMNDAARKSGESRDYVRRLAEKKPWIHSAILMRGDTLGNLRNDDDPGPGKRYKRKICRNRGDPFTLEVIEANVRPVTVVPMQVDNNNNHDDDAGGDE